MLPSPPTSPDSLDLIKKTKKIKIIGDDGREMTRIQKLANLEILMEWLNTSTLSPFNGISGTNRCGVSALDILESNKKLVSRLLWDLFWEFIICPSQISKNKEYLLLSWIINLIAKYEHKSFKEVEPTINFKSERWNDNGGLTIKLAKSLGIIPSEKDSSIIEIFADVYNIYKIPPFLDIDDMNEGIIDEFSIFAYFACWFEVFNRRQQKDGDKTLTSGDEISDNESSKSLQTSETSESSQKKSNCGAFSEFFGPNVLNRASAISQHDYDMSLKLRIETFIVIASKIISLKNKFLSKLETLLLEIVNLMGQFDEYENASYKDTTIISNEHFLNGLYEADDLQFKAKSLYELEKIIINTQSEEGTTDDKIKETKYDLTPQITEAIQNIGFIINYRKSSKYRIYEQFIELKLFQSHLSDMLDAYGLQKLTEPPEKSLGKISKFIELLNKSEFSLYSNANNYVECRLKKLNILFNDDKKSLSDAFNLLENDVLQANGIFDFENRKKEFETIKADIPGLKMLHLRTVKSFNDIEMIHSSLGRGFDKQSYKLIINDQRNKLNFIEDCIDKSIKFMVSLQTQTNEAEDVLKIANIAEEYSKSKEIQEFTMNDEDKKQLNTHLLVHRLIQTKFQIKKNIDPIQVLFDKNDTGSKGYLTKSEFRKAFLVAYPNTATLAGVEEVDTVFETSYETVGKLRRGIEYEQFRAIIELGNIGETNTLTERHPHEHHKDIDKFLDKINKANVSIDLTNNMFYNSFIELTGNHDILCDTDFNKIRLHPLLKDKVETIFPDFKYADWFKHVDQSSIYQDNEECEEVDVGFGGKPRDIALKNVLYDLEKVDLSKI